MIKRICLHCGQPFYVHNYRADSAKFCSRACYADFRATQAYERECAYCGRTFRVTRRTRYTKYCSRECLNKDSHYFLQRKYDIVKAFYHDQV